MENKEFLSVKQLADLLGISRVAVFYKIKSGMIKAEKVGKTYIIPRTQLKGGSLAGQDEKLKKEIDKGVKKVVAEYGETLKMLGKE